AAIQRADYRGDRAELERRGAAVAAPAPSHRLYREYWAGFAFWRRGMNGWSETPKPADLATDFERCAEHERAALALDSTFDDARGALAGCLLGQAFSDGVAAERRTALLRQATDLLKELEARAESNPRSLWMIGGKYMSAPAQAGGDPA